MSNLRDEYVQMLERENDELRERIVALEEAVGMRIEVPIVFQLSGAEARVFGALLKRDMLTKQQAMHALYAHRPDGDGEVEIKIVDVFVCKLRKKLKRFDISIETVWGQGYRMSAASKALAAGFLEQARAA